MFIGVKNTKKSDFNEKIIFFFWIPIYKKVKTSNLKIKKLLGLTIKKSRVVNSTLDMKKTNEFKLILNDKNIENLLTLLKISDKQKDMDVLYETLSVNLRELQRFKNDIIKKFPELKNNKFNEI